MLSESEKTELLNIARKTLEVFLKAGQVPHLEVDSPNLREPAGAFVTLRNVETLRGCIGLFESPDPLYKTVQRMSLASAKEDPRFQSVEYSELIDIRIEISVLSPRKPIESLEDIEVGKHGLYVSKGSSHGVLLPQVATEYGWDRNQFLSETCVKAGLSPSEWKKGGVDIEIFTAEICVEKLGG